MKVLHHCHMVFPYECSPDGVGYKLWYIYHILIENGWTMCEVDVIQIDSNKSSQRNSRSPGSYIMYLLKNYTAKLFHSPLWF